MSGKKPRELNIKLLCPSLSKVAQVVAWEDQRIDLGFISRAFGLDPSSLRLNGHFISRGVDLIASSLTWNSVLSFFSAKGLSTGKDQCDALVVTGKLCKIGLKRMSIWLSLFPFFFEILMMCGRHDSLNFQSGIGKIMENENAGNIKGIQPEAINLFKSKKLKESTSGDILNGQSCKRKQLLEDVNLFKKLKINEDKSGKFSIHYIFFTKVAKLLLIFEIKLMISVAALHATSLHAAMQVESPSGRTFNPERHTLKTQVASPVARLFNPERTRKFNHFPRIHSNVIDIFETPTEAVSTDVNT
ncbi:unnamed protein product [Sphenostylis stenocarpa]|uniref:Uncharacterized protein n=1 Tax=Sphenostylis stenocarpa TaxID=92480 RepID=A0AA86SAW5_9FABA|nr:unnamed protein product [Sphenostylis stenocarpa]